jgi:hypothetical protein
MPDGSILAFPQLYGSDGAEHARLQLLADNPWLAQLPKAFVDPAIYSIDREFRMHGSSKAPGKPGERNPACFIASGHSLEQSLVGFFPSQRPRHSGAGPVSASWSGAQGPAAQRQAQRQAAAGRPAGRGHDHQSCDGACAGAGAAAAPYSIL